MRPTTNFTLHAILAAVIAAAAATSAAAARPAYLKLGGVEGEAAKGDKPRIAVLEVQSWSWGEAQAAGTHAGGGGGGSGKVNVHDISVTKTTDHAAKGGNVEYEWKVEEGESAPPAPGGGPDMVMKGSKIGENAPAPGEAEITLKGNSGTGQAAPRPRPSDITLKRGASSVAEGGEPLALAKPLDKGSVRVKVKFPWAACRVGARYPTLELADGGRRYLLQDVTVASCGGSAAEADRPTEEVAFYYNKISF